MKCRSCGSEINDGDVFCPVCSALAPTKYNGRLSKLNGHSGRGSVSILCLCEILLSILFISSCFFKCFIIANEQIYLKFSFYDTFLGNSKFNFVLIIILNILTNIVLLSFIIKKIVGSRAALLIPAATYVWSIVQFIIKTINASNIEATRDSTVRFSITPAGRIQPIVCVVSIALLIIIALKLGKKNP